MRFKRRGHYGQAAMQMDAAPVLSIIFLLLIFILLIAGVMGLPGIKVNLPGLITSAAFKSRNLEIVINKEGAILYKAGEISLEQFKRTLLQLPLSQTAVLIKADKDVSLLKLMRVWQVCQELGLEQVNIASAE